MDKSTSIDARGANIGALAIDRSMAENSGNLTMQVNLEPAAATQVAFLLGELVVQLKTLNVSAEVSPDLNETIAKAQEAKDVANSANPDKSKLSSAWGTVKEWVNGALRFGVFAVDAAAKVKDLIGKLSGLLG